MEPRVDMGPAAGGSLEVYAGTFARLLAYLVDAILLTATLFVASMALRAALGPVVRFQPVAGTPGARVMVDQGRMITTGIVSAALSATYFIGSWVGWPATPGQRLLGIRVGRAADGRRLTVGRAAARWLFLMGPLGVGALAATLRPGLRASFSLATLAWYLILLVTTVRSRTRQGLHDRYAGSVVITGARGAGPVGGTRL